MAGGWTRDGAVQDQIDDTVKDAVLGARALRRTARAPRNATNAASRSRATSRGVARRAHLRRLPGEREQERCSLDHQPPRQQGQPAALISAGAADRLEPEPAFRQTGA